MGWNVPDKATRYPSGLDAGKRRDYMRDYMRARRGSENRGDLPFVGCDGEGGGETGDKHPGYHAYFLLRIGGDVLKPKDGNIRLTTSECLEFIATRPPSATYVGYFFDYDVTKILEDLPVPKLKRLMDRGSRTRKNGNGVFPVSYGPYEFDYLPRKEFKVRKGKGPWVVINDVGPFFQTKFVTALEKWGIGTEEELALITAGKDMRGNFEYADIEEIGRYNAMEIKLLQGLMGKFREACRQSEIMPARWQGPGQLAKALMTRHGVPKTSKVPLLNDPAFTGLLEYGRNAYYGGRPELLAIGPVNRPVWQYDINSAYPRAMLDVPCLMHDGWRFEEYATPIPSDQVPGTYAICYGSYTPVHSNGNRYPMWYGLPHRTKDGTIQYPGAGRGWYWGFEIAASKHQSFAVESAWIYERRCDCRPLGFVDGVYQQRLALGKDDAGMVLKLALNSLYGISVQSIGNPQYANPIWGSFITAYCRAQIQGFIHTSPSCTDPKAWCGKDVLMIATDSVCTWRERADIPVSKELGGWSVEEHPRGMFLIQPGLYFGSSGKHAKTRGVPQKVIEEKEGEFRAAFERMMLTHQLEDGDVSVPQRLFAGIRYALQRRNHKLLGQWIEFEDEDGKTGKTIRFDWTSKRAIYPVIDPSPFNSYLETFPKKGDPKTETLPYAKDIGGLVLRESLRTVYVDQPDWVPQIEPGEMSNGKSEV